MLLLHDDLKTARCVLFARRPTIALSKSHASNVLAVGGRRKGRLFELRAAARPTASIPAVFGAAVSSPAANAAAKADPIGKKIGELVHELQPFWRDLMEPS